MTRPRVQPTERALPLRLLRYAAAILLIAGIVHLATILVLARDAETSAFAEVSTLGHAVHLKTFPGAAAAARVLPYRDPAMANAFCLFDLREGAVDVSLPVTPLDVATLSVHDRHGQAVYALTNRSAVRGVLALSVMTPAMIAAKETEETDDGALRVPLEEGEGFVMVQALAAMPSLRPTAEATAGGLTCRAEPRG